MYVILMIKNINFSEYKERFKDYTKNFFIDQNVKKNYGIVYTPFILVEQILTEIPNFQYKKLDNKWLDVGSGFGNFSFILYEKLFNSLKDNFFDTNILHDHIINNMIYMSEINDIHIKYLNNLFGENINLLDNFLTLDNNIYNNYFDIIIGNPPYNYGVIKTPTNNIISKKSDGKSIWQQFIIKALDLLKDKGYLCMIIPVIWLKPDKAGIYNLLTQYKIIKLFCFSNSETNKIFNYEAQTPTCFFILQKEFNIDNNINIYDKIYKIYIPYNLQLNYPIPMFNISIINKFLYYVKKYGYINVHKTNSPSINCNFASHFSQFYSYKSINSCILTGDNKLIPELLETYCNIPTSYYQIPKIILAHKMYGIPFLDISGSYGISARDNYVIKDYSIDQLKNISLFFSTKTILFLYNSTAYRMKYLEKYIFYFIPDISKIESLNNLPNNIDEREKIIWDFFNLSILERETIQNSVKNYKFFI